MNLTKSKTIKSYPIRENSDVLKILLKDRTSRKNIIWATASYEDMGEGYQVKDHIKESLFANGAGKIIKPRVEKDNEEQTERTRGKGEVFTPTWIIKKKVDLIEEELSKLDLEDYICQRWLEITCGEAPYMTSRYDTVTGEYLDIDERVGFLDRKLQRISKEIDSEEIWFSLALKAYQSSYGYEYQGDSLLIARENLLNSFIDYYVAKFNHMPGLDKIEDIAIIISYNVFQMDGLKYILPMPEKIRVKEFDVQLSFFGDVETEEQQLEVVIEEGEEVKVKNWLNNRMVKFKDLVDNEGGVGTMKFDVVIGNPPYQDEAVGTSTSDDPIYHLFMDQAYCIADKVCLITPARFLFNAGKTPESWNRKMLQDVHFKVEHYIQKSNDVFKNTDIKGGVVITYRDKGKNFGEIGTFTSFRELNEIRKKVVNNDTFENIMPIINTQNKFNLNALYKDYPKYKSIIGSNGRDKRLRQIIMERLPEIFTESKKEDESYKILGLIDRQRSYRYVPQKYIEDNGVINKYKVFVASANGSGALGEVLSTPLIGEPLVGITQTFISFGKFDTRAEAEAMLKYVKTKFCRTLLGVLKITQGNNRSTWANVPTQNFTSESDIDWSQSIAEIDQQLYKKYGLDEEEINFIESNVKEME